MSTVGKSVPVAEGEEKKMVTVTIDGKEVVVEEGSSLFNAIKDTGVELPAMCYHYSFSPFGSCGLCLVEVEGKKNNVRACTAKSLDGMVVHTETDKMTEARKKAVEKHLTTHPLDCPVCDADGQCELQDMTYDLGVYDIKKGKKRKDIPEDNRSVVLGFNMERCIRCGQCINVCKEVQLVDALCFYKENKNTLVGAHGGGTLFCEFCGDCLAVCPVGAIVNNFSKYAYKPWQLKKTKTTCNYCSDGCQITLESKDQSIIQVSSDFSWESKFGFDVGPGDGHGGICVRGRFGFQYIESKKRLSHALMKTGEGFTEVPWYKALSLMAKQLNDIKSTHGGQAIAGLIGGRCSNEAVFLFQRLMRGILDSNNIDTSARYGHMNSVLAMQHALGVGRSTTSYEQIALSDVILLVGSNITETNPIAALRLKKAKSDFNATIIVAERWETKMMALAAQPLQIAPGSEVLFLQGLVKAVISTNNAYKPFVEKYSMAYKAIELAVSGLSEEDISEGCGLPWEKIVEAAESLAQSKRGTLIWGEGIVSQEGGYENVQRLLDLAFLTGLFEKEGAGIHPICEESNEQGAVDMGAVPEFLPGQVTYESETSRQRFASAWHSKLPDPKAGQSGLSLGEMIEAAHRGEIKALYLVGENPLGSLPASFKVKEALEKIDLIICQDPFMTESAAVADFVLPAATFAENEGSMTDMAGVVHRLAEVIDPRVEAKPDWKIFSDLSRALGHSLQFRSSEEIYQEINKLVPGYFRQKLPSVQYDDYLKKAFVDELPARYGKPSSDHLKPQKDSKFSLRLEQSLYHSGKLSTHDEGLMKIDDKAVLGIGERDAESLALLSGNAVVLKTTSGQVDVPIEISPELPSGVLSFPIHFNMPPINDLISVSLDPQSHVIYARQAMVSLELDPAQSLNVLPPTNNGAGKEVDAEQN